MSQIKLFGGTRSKPRSVKPERPKKAKSPLKTITILLLVLAVLEGAYFTCVYSNIPFIAKWRNIYIQTAMSTMRHQWLATAFIPQGVIDEVMADQRRGQEEQANAKDSTWGTDGKEPAGQESSDPNSSAVGRDPEEAAFYELFWEIDPDSMNAYLEKHPNALANGWDQLYINEAGLDDDGTDIYTNMGEQVLAIDVPNQVLLVRVKGSNYRGVLAVAKDPAKLSIKNSSMLGSAGQYAGTIAANHGGVLAMTASGFIDEGGVGNGGILAGYAMSDGQSTGSHMSWSYKRLELRNDNLMYITDAQSQVHSDTTDAVEFTPALIIDGEIIVDGSSGWTAMNPRACIGQSKKGEILMLVVEGRLVGYSLGIDVIECAEILSRHNCMQAMNLDGGTSAIMWYDGEYVTRCSNTACPEGRPLPNAFVYEGT